MSQKIWSLPSKTTASVNAVSSLNYRQIYELLMT